jgi:hypothetical protein
MQDFILSTPGLYLYLMLVVVLLIAALWTRESDPPVGEPRATALTAGRGVGDVPSGARYTLDRVHLRHSGLPTQRGGRAFRNIEATLSASYAARLEQAIRTIRIE